MTESTISHDITSPAPGVLDAAAARAEAAQPSLGATFREIFRDLVTYRELMYEFTRRDIRIRYKQAVMGFGWAVFMPILIVASGVLVRFAMGQVEPLRFQPLRLAIGNTRRWARRTSRASPSRGSPGRSSSAPSPSPPARSPPTTT